MPSELALSNCLEQTILPHRKRKQHMGFLQWLVSNQEEPEEEQLSLDLNGHNPNSNLQRRERVDGSVVNKDYRKAIQNKGGDEQCQVDSSVQMSKELFDMSPAQLYQRTGGRPYDRSTLPKDAQKALIVGETVAAHDLNGKEVQGVSQREINCEITDTVKESGKKARKLFPW
jgi:hypothetical protein